MYTAARLASTGRAAVFLRAELPQSKPDGFASSLGEGAFGMAGEFLIASETLALGLAACALSVTCGDSSPKGRAKSTAGNFLVTPSTLASGLTAWLSLWESWRGSAGEGSARLRQAETFPQRRAFAESGAANAVSLHDPSREKAILENPQIFQNCKIKIIFPLIMARA